MKCANCTIKEICNIYSSIKSFGQIATIQIEECLYFASNLGSAKSCGGACKCKTEEKAEVETEAETFENRSTTVEHVNSLIKSVLDPVEEPYFVPSPLKSMGIIDSNHCYICAEIKTDECAICKKAICENHAISQIGRNEQPITICESCFLDSPTK